jgi:ribosomal protein S18 acetylase RimI-like enzyme
MIRERIDQDLDRLVAVLTSLDAGTDVLAGRSAYDWLTELDADVSWVFDQAPVSVAPTRNVVGHVQVYSPPVGTPWLASVASTAGVAPDRLLVIGRFFVKEMRFGHNIGRYLLTECVKRIRARGSIAVLDPDGLALVPRDLRRRLGFADDTEVPVLAP